MPAPWAQHGLSSVCPFDRSPRTCTPCTCRDPANPSTHRSGHMCRVAAVGVLAAGADGGSPDGVTSKASFRVRRSTMATSMRCRRRCGPSEESAGAC